MTNRQLFVIFFCLKRSGLFISFDVKKKRILYHSDSCRANTGFGRHSKALLKYLYNTGKYEIIQYAMGTPKNYSEHEYLPWICKGTIPDNASELAAQLQGLNPIDAEMKKRQISYGAVFIDDMIKTYKPDVYIGTQDIWAFNGYFNKVWWNKVNCIVHTTLDSLPILSEAIECADKIKHYYVWASFAEKALHKLGHTHVKTLHGAIDTQYFSRLPEPNRIALRKQNNIPTDAFVIGFVFRNQLRKSVVKLLQGFKLFCEANPKTDAYLLLHTHWTEGRGGWNIAQRIKELGINPKKVLTTYYCRHCEKYEVKPYELPELEWKKDRVNASLGQHKNCRYCGQEKSQVTCNTAEGVTETELNEIYNLMDVYCHPFTSGGQEIPIQEAKLVELITLVTDYSCGEEYCLESNGGLPLAWQEYREPGTEFIKATTSESSIARQLTKVLKMNIEKKRAAGKLARDFVINNIDISAVGAEFEKILDNLPEVNWDFDFTTPAKNPNYTPTEVDNDVIWVKDLYKNILNVEVKDNDEGLLYWLQELSSKKRTREDVLAYFRNVALKENEKEEKIEAAEFFDGPNKKLLIVIKESIGDIFILTSLFKSIKEQYPDHDIYISTQPQYFDILLGNPYIYKVIPYHPNFENEMIVIGAGQEKGLVDVFMHPAIATQRVLNYLSNKTINLNLNY